MCDEWQNYKPFAEWARSHGYEDDLTIERIDVNGNYCPQNCTWIPKEKQARNRTTTRIVEYRGIEMSLAEAADRRYLRFFPGAGAAGRAVQAGRRTVPGISSGK